MIEPESETHSNGVRNANKTLSRQTRNLSHSTPEFVLHFSERMESLFLKMTSMTQCLLHQNIHKYFSEKIFFLSSFPNNMTC